MCSGGWETEVAKALFTCLSSESPERLGMHYMSFDRHFQGNHSSVKIVGNGAVLTEIFKGQVWRLWTMRGNEVQSLGITFRQSKCRRTDTSDDVGNLEEKGDRTFYWNSLMGYTWNQVMIRPFLVSLISPVPHYGLQSKLISLESHDHGESNAISCKVFGSELVEDVGNYRVTIKGA